MEAEELKDSALTQIKIGNKLIAESLGWKFVEIDDNQLQASYRGNVRWIDNKERVERINLFSKGFNFHLSWDDLMQVFDVISSLPWCSYTLNATQCIIRMEERDSAGLRTGLGFEVSKYNKDKSKAKETAWLAVVEFFTWYQKNKK